MGSLRIRVQLVGANKCEDRGRVVSEEERVIEVKRRFEMQIAILTLCMLRLGSSWSRGFIIVVICSRLTRRLLGRKLVIPRKVAARNPNEVCSNDENNLRPKGLLSVDMSQAANRKAIVTLVVGELYHSIFNRLCRRNWEAYARRHGYDLIVFERLLDTSARAAARSPAWQKCLVPEQPELRDYSQVVWLDTDILINGEAPCIVANVPEDKIGAVDSHSWPTPDIYPDLARRLCEMHRVRGLPFVPDSSASEFYSSWGLPAEVTRAVQTGVLVFSPRHHAPIFRRVYDAYEDKGTPHWNYEMRPLSYEMVKADIVSWLNVRFNVV